MYKYHCIICGGEVLRHYDTPDASHSRCRVKAVSEKRKMDKIRLKNKTKEV